MTKQQQEQADARSNLNQWIKPGDTVYTILRHVSRSGMQREIGIVLMEPRPRESSPHNPKDWRATVRDIHPNHAVATLLGLRLNKNGDGIKIGGCGMDMGFHLVYNLSRVLFDRGFTCTGEGCHSNDHSNGDRDYTPHPHSDPGYALTHRWL